MVFYCVTDGIFWTTAASAKPVLSAPKKPCPDCVKYDAWLRENEPKAKR